MICIFIIDILDCLVALIIQFLSQAPAFCYTPTFDQFSWIIYENRNRTEWLQRGQLKPCFNIRTAQKTAALTSCQLHVTSRMERFVPLGDFSFCRAGPWTPHATVPGITPSAAAPPWCLRSYNKLSERFRSATRSKTSTLLRPPCFLLLAVTWWIGWTMSREGRDRTALWEL